MSNECRMNVFVGRVDVAVRCPAEGDFDVAMEWVSSLGNTVTIAALSVASSSEQADADLESWEPCRWVRSH